MRATQRGVYRGGAGVTEKVEEILAGGFPPYAQAQRAVIEKQASIDIRAVIGFNRLRISDTKSGTVGITRRLSVITQLIALSKKLHLTASNSTLNLR